MENPLPLSDIERIKADSRYLRGTIRESLADPSVPTLYPDDLHLIKFHGAYMQSDRLQGKGRKDLNLDLVYSFMVRARVPAGLLMPLQWLGIDSLADQYGDGTIKLTTRQTMELHRVLKQNLKKVIKGVNDIFLDTFAACGDVNRNVMASAGPYLSGIHAEVHQVARDVQRHLTPKTTAYRELWLEGASVSATGEKDQEPVYGPTYLPRKFKIAFAIPPSNDTDVFANDLGFIAIVDGGELVGFNVVAGGGMGMTLGMAGTFPRLGDALGFISKDKVIDVCEKAVLVQRDHGNRSNRKLSRLKYTIEKMTVNGFKVELERRLGFFLEAPRPFRFTSSGDRFGWQKGDDGKWHVTLFIEGGRVKDAPDYPMKTGLKEIARIHKGVFILTGNQNLIIANIDPGDRQGVQALLDQYRVTQHQQITAGRGNSLVCAARPLCPLAITDAETYFPAFMDKLDAVLVELGLQDVPVSIRMTGCPNGCARPSLGEIALVGRAPGKYNLYLGAGHAGDRLNILYKEKLGEQDILAVLKDVLSQYARMRLPDEKFGDFTLRQGIVSLNFR